MPVKIWTNSEDQGVASHIESDRPTRWTTEELREEAEELDRLLDRVLDAAVDAVRRCDGTGVPLEFLRAWAVGHSLRTSEISDVPALRNEQPFRLWQALASKCRTGCRADRNFEQSWADLRPQRAKEPRREGGRLDYFEMCRWLAEQDLEDAAATFGGHVRNVWQMLERPSLRPIVVRRAFLGWLRSLPEETRNRLLEPKTFAEMMKVLRRRWPDRGPGSARRPIHYREEDLRREIGLELRNFALDQPPA